MRTTHSDVGAVVLSQYIEPAFALDLFEAGAEGRAHLLKDRLGDAAQLVGALREVARAGRRSIPGSSSGWSKGGWPVETTPWPT